MGGFTNEEKLLSVLMAAVMVAGVGGVGAAQVKLMMRRFLVQVFIQLLITSTLILEKRLQMHAMESLKQTSKMDRMTSLHRTIRLIQCWLKALL